MSPDTVYPGGFSKPELKSNFRAIGWTNTMSQFLMGTEIFKKENENEKCLNPNVVMDIRHKMVKQFPKIIPLPQEQINTNALELLRTENHKKLQRQREKKMVENEIGRLKQNFENHRLLTKKKLDEIPKRTNYSVNKPIFPKQYTKLCKRLELGSGTCEVDTWVGHSVQMTMETKITPQGIPFDVKVSLKRKETIEEHSERLSTKKGSLNDNEVEEEKHCWEEDEGKNEIMKRFFEKRQTEAKPEVQVDVKNEIKEIEIPEIRSKMNQRRVENAWVTWKAYIDQLKNRRKEKTIYKGKIEAFLSKLQERHAVEVKNKNLKQITNRKQDIKKIMFEKAKLRNKELVSGRNDEKLQKIVQEIKASRAEATSKLLEITKTNLENQKKYQNIKFLQKMEERKEERLKRRKELQEKKRILEEEKENARKQKEEEEKRKKLEELKEMRRLEKEKIEEQRREREKLKQKLHMADCHYRKYLLHSCGMRPWKMLMKMAYVQQQRAVEFFERRVTRMLFLTWATNVREETGLKRRLADELYEKILKKNYLRVWMEFHKENIEQSQVAVDWNEFKITEKAFKKWLRFTLDEQLEDITRQNIAILKYEQKLKMKFLKKMREYPEFKKLEQAKENRKRKWREKVKEILPDFRPIEISEYS